ncbi:MAG: DUF362 domain-containing protein [Clostridia bacterium]
MKEIVSLVKCDDYELENVKTGLQSLVDNLGGLDKFVKSGQKVLVKANLLNNFKVETASTTHPNVILALCEMLIEKGCDVTIGDSSGGFYNKAHMSNVYKVTGMAYAAEQTGAKLNDDFSYSTVKFDGGVASKNFDIINAALSADVIINVAKLKTHSFTYYTGAVKNLFGLIPGVQKVQMHSQNANLLKFFNFIIDIEEYIKDKIALNIIDGIVGMEGAGPSAGTPKNIKSLIASTSAFACDYVAIKLTNAKPIDFPEFYLAKERGISPVSDEEVEVVGYPLAKLVVKDFKHVPNDKLWNVEKVMRKPFVKVVAPYPSVKKSQCKGCGKCHDHCPNQAITMVNNVATFDLNLCIRCFCCQELCPYHLIKVKRSIVSRILSKL